MAQTTVNGITVPIYKMSYIKNLFTSKVKEYLDKGYNICIKGMQSLCSDDDGHIDLTNDGGNSVYRVRLVHSHSLYCNDTYSIIVSYFENCLNKSLWNSRGKEISKDVFDFIGMGYTHDLQDSLPFIKENNDFMKELEKIRAKRWDARHIDGNRHIPATSKVLEVVNKQKGCKSVKLSDIRYFERSYREGYLDGYYVRFKGTKPTLWLPMNVQPMKTK